MGLPDVALGVAVVSTPAIASVVAGLLGVSGIVAGVLAPAGPAAADIPAAHVVTAPVVPGPEGGVPRPFIGPDPVGGGASLDTLARLDGVALLDQLARLTPGEFDAFLAKNPTALDELSANPPAAAAVAEWWAGAPTAARTLLTMDLPGVLGNLEGLPYQVRDAANRAFLNDTVAGIRAQLDAGVGRAMEDELTARLVMLDSVQEALKRGPSGAARTLIALDVTGEGRAVIGIGRLEAADYITFYVPGMYVGVSQQLVDWAGNAETGLLEQREWLDRLGRDAEVATIAWIGYHTPTVVSIGSLDLAFQGRIALTRSLQGLDAVRGSAAGASGLGSGGLRAAGPVPDGPLTDATPAPFVTVVAHSYGSTAAMISLEDDDVAIDALVMVGSPGGPATNVDELKVADGNVWVAAAETDPIQLTGVYGSQPLDAGFGAHHFSVKATTDPITGEELADISGHVYYFWPGTTSVRNTALIAIDEGRYVTTDAPADVTATRVAATRGSGDGGS